MNQFFRIAFLYFLTQILSSFILLDNDDKSLEGKKKGKKKKKAKLKYKRLSF